MNVAFRFIVMVEGVEGVVGDGSISVEWGVEDG